LGTSFLKRFSNLAWFLRHLDLAADRVVCYEKFVAKGSEDDHNPDANPTNYLSPRPGREEGGSHINEEITDRKMEWAIALTPNETLLSSSTTAASSESC
jgi:hypothetical protein